MKKAGGKDEAMCQYERANKLDGSPVRKSKVEVAVCQFIQNTKLIIRKLKSRAFGTNSKLIPEPETRKLKNQNITPPTSALP